MRDIELVVQWRYTQSLCTLWQRLGRAARDPCKEATGIYMVEPQYMDKKRKEAEKRAGERTERALAANPGDPRGEPQGERSGHGTRKRPRSRVNQAPTHVPQAAGNLIVEEGRHGSYEVAAMETYINARQRGICRRNVSNEFFGNRPCECICIGDKRSCDPRSNSVPLISMFQ